MKNGTKGQCSSHAARSAGLSSSRRSDRNHTSTGDSFFTSHRIAGNVKGFCSADFRPIYPLSNATRILQGTGFVGPATEKHIACRSLSAGNRWSLYPTVSQRLSYGFALRVHMQMIVDTSYVETNCVDADAELSRTGLVAVTLHQKVKHLHLTF